MGFFRSRGYKVNFTGKAGLIYTEGSRKMTIESDNIVDRRLTGFDVEVYADTIGSWDPPYDGEALSDDKRRQIVDNIRSDLERYGLKVRLG